MCEIYPLRALTRESDEDVNSRHCAAVVDWCCADGHNVLRRILGRLASRTFRRITKVDVVVVHLRRPTDLELGVDVGPGQLVAVGVRGRVGRSEPQAPRLRYDAEAGAK